MSIVTLESRIVRQMAACKSARQRLAIARHRRERLMDDLEKIDQEIAELSDAHHTLRDQGRDWVFQLLLRSPHRRFMRFLNKHA